MTIVIDIDGTVAQKVENWDYANCEAIEGAVEKVNALHDRGAFIIFHTARPKKDYTVTVTWLIKKGFKFHQLVMDKPLGDVYIDDKALRFVEWDDAVAKTEVLWKTRLCCELLI